MANERSHGAGEGPVAATAARWKRPTTLAEARHLRQSALGQRNEFWLTQAGQLRWERVPTRGGEGEPPGTWFADGRLNAASNALGVAGPGDERLALRFFEPGGGCRELTLAQLRQQVRRAAAALVAAGVGPDARVALYLPDCPEAVVLMVAAAWVGATYVPIPWRLPASLAAACIQDCGAGRVLVGEGAGGAAEPDYAARVVELEATLPSGVLWPVGDFRSATDAAGAQDQPAGGVPAPASVAAEHPLLLLYSKSSPGVPRGSYFATAGLLVQALTVQRLLFGPRPEGVFCTHDLASAVGQSHGLWGTLLSAGTLVLSAPAGRPTPAQLQQALSSQPGLSLLTNPAYLSAVQPELAQSPLATRFSSVACSGEVLAPRLVAGAATTLCDEPHQVLNMWLFAEAGAALVATLPAADLQRPGALGFALPGVEIGVRNDLGHPCKANESGQLLVAGSWPAMARGIWGQPERYRDLFLRRFPGWFHTSDGARLDSDGFFWFMGRLDDRVKVRGQSVATSEIEAVLVAHPGVTEAAVLGVRREGETELWAFVVPRGADTPASLANELRETVAHKLGAFAVPGRFSFAAELPRTRTGKVVRRLLRRVATGDYVGGDDLGHVRNPACLDEIIRRG